MARGVQSKTLWAMATIKCRIPPDNSRHQAINTPRIEKK
jgi:hypothetical protein